jgi:hypothetical protein
MQNPFRFACRSGGVEDEQRIFRIHRLRRTFRRDIAARFAVPEEVAPRFHRYVGASALDG